MARRNVAGQYAYRRTALLRGREPEGRFAVIQKDREQTRVAQRLPDGSAPGPGFLVPTSEVYDVKPTHVVPVGKRGTITLPEPIRQELGIEEGTPLEIMLQDDHRLSVRPLTRTPGPVPPAVLDELVRRITPENLHGEVSVGGPVGGESW